MLEIDEIIPHYICNQGSRCREMDACQTMCKHSSLACLAKNPEVIDIFNKFADTFHVVVDDYGRLVCTEKEKK